MEWHRHPLVLVLAVLVAVVILYYVTSPYQICTRTFGDLNDWCFENTGW